MNIQFLNCSLKNIPLIQQCVKLYCEIWKEPPWHEEWDEKRVFKDIEKELNEPFAKMILALVNKQVIGFTWGYLIEKNKLRQISGAEDLDFVFNKNSKVYYIDELGVNILYRGKGIGKDLTDNLLLAMPRIINKIILRIDKNAESARKALA